MEVHNRSVAHYTRDLSNEKGTHRGFLKELFVFVFLLALKLTSFVGKDSRREQSEFAKQLSKRNSTFAVCFLRPQ